MRRRRERWTRSFSASLSSCSRSLSRVARAVARDLSGASATTARRAERRSDALSPARPNASSRRARGRPRTEWGRWRRVSRSAAPRARSPPGRAAAGRGRSSTIPTRGSLRLRSARSVTSGTTGRSTSCLERSETGPRPRSRVAAELERLAPAPGAAPRSAPARLEPRGALLGRDACSGRTRSSVTRR